MPLCSALQLRDARAHQPRADKPAGKTGGKHAVVDAVNPHEHWFQLRQNILFFRNLGLQPVFFLGPNPARAPTSNAKEETVVTTAIRTMRVKSC